MRQIWTDRAQITRATFIKTYHFPAFNFDAFFARPSPAQSNVHGCWSACRCVPQYQPLHLHSKPVKPSFLLHAFKLQRDLFTVGAAGGASSPPLAVTMLATETAEPPPAAAPLPPPPIATLTVAAGTGVGSSETGRTPDPPGIVEMAFAGGSPTPPPMSSAAATAASTITTAVLPNAAVGGAAIALLPPPSPTPRTPSRSGSRVFSAGGGGGGAGGATDKTFDGGTGAGAMSVKVGRAVGTAAGSDRGQTARGRLGGGGRQSSQAQRRDAQRACKTGTHHLLPPAACSRKNKNQPSQRLPKSRSHPCTGQRSTQTFFGAGKLIMRRKSGGVGRRAIKE